MDRDNSTTERFLAEAGIGADMRVLEIGCGNGEVTQLLAGLVGTRGEVVAIDNNAASLDAARKRMSAAKIAHVTFVTADVASDLTALEPYARQSFDAIAGRRVVMYLQTPHEVLRRLADWLRPDGLAVFEEADATIAPGRTTPLPAHDRGVDWLRRMLVAEGADPSMGLNLPATLERAGIAFERIRGVAVIEGQGVQYPLPELLSLMRQRLAAMGIATEAQLDELLPRLAQEAGAAFGTYVSGMSFCAWGRKR